MFKDPPTVKHPEWIDGALKALGDSMRLYRKGAIPPCLQGAMLAVPAIRLLRCIYGSDFETAAAIREQAEEAVRLDSQIAGCRTCHGTASVSNAPCPKCFPELAEQIGVKP